MKTVKLGEVELEIKHPWKPDTVTIDRADLKRLLKTYRAKYAASVINWGGAFEHELIERIKELLK